VTSGSLWSPARNRKTAENLSNSIRMEERVEEGRKDLDREQ